MGKLWDIVQSYIDAQDYPPSERRVAERLHVSPTTLKAWRTPKKLPHRETLEAIAKLTRTPYRNVVEAAMDDTRYWIPSSQDSTSGDVGAGNKEPEKGGPGLSVAEHAESVTRRDDQSSKASGDK